MPDLTKPPALKPGDRVGIVAPASNIDGAHLQAGVAALVRMGYEPVYDPGILDRDLYFAGTLERRAREFHTMFERDDIRAVLCARGGYGANYLLPEVDIDLVRRHPKIFVGYSDVSCLLMYLHDATGMVPFHGPMVAKDFAEPGGVDEASWRSAVGGDARWSIAPHESFGPILEGEAEGVLYGGCLSILVASLGTPFEARTEGKLLFVEDVNAKPYQVDRMLMQMKMAGKFEGVRGIIFGEMLNCAQSADQPYTLQEVIARVVGDLKVPIAYGLRSGHVSSQNITLPIGVRARLTVARKARLEIMESAVLSKPRASSIVE
ncbi:MAG: S66 peptidase family protein [Terriglobales bacterium]